ncbi:MULTISPECIES: metallophosphoesterase family protein [unclassified Mucilaginibacter]|uniref:metallophosphoesterase family protein n=1 Tax=unclassified Mucilaginibacter TaxID=2617802 RepID=UPI000ACD316C|nr:MULTISPECIES: metallophosphoesterase [unclassified Mucilaginibacter]PLW90772.1 MAG: metallophosphoesterase [Mucilaginibacter sp.]HEK20659.1 metallophosphoesterase [Bacteroidota bacterium]
MKQLIGILLSVLALVTQGSAQDRPVMAFASDTQEPMWVEKIFLRSNHNLQATKMIFKDVDSLRPKAFFILGDVVSLGKSKKAWKNIDRYLEQTVKDSIPVYATLGNHEVMFNTDKGTVNFRKRFPAYDPSGYAVVIDSVAVVLLNSNFGQMPVEAIVKQDKWYTAKLEALDADPAVKLVIVGCHHSPYTNSKIVSPSTAVQDNFVPQFIRSKKAVLFLSGHSHNFERYQMQGKTFLVIGGGGGLHQPLKANNAAMNDMAIQYKPEFHYLQITRSGEKLDITSRRLKPDFSGFDDGYHLQVGQ